jgi:hypothetical protein
MQVRNGQFNPCIIFMRPPWRFFYVSCMLLCFPTCSSNDQSGKSRRLLLWRRVYNVCATAVYLVDLLEVADNLALTGLSMCCKMRSCVTESKLIVTSSVTQPISSPHGPRRYSIADSVAVPAAPPAQTGCSHWFTSLHPRGFGVRNSP